MPPTEMKPFAILEIADEAFIVIRWIGEIGDAPHFRAVSKQPMTGEDAAEACEQFNSGKRISMQ